MKSKKSSKKCWSCRSDKLILGLVAFLMLASAIVIIGNKIPERRNETRALAQSSQTDEKTKLVAFVNKAVTLVSNQGPKAFTEFRKQNTQWWTGESYIFVYDMNGKTLVLPAQQNLEGTNRMGTKDADGVYFVKEMLNTLKNSSSGWLTYSYPKPGESNPSPKVSFFRKATFGNQVFLVGSGIYTK